MRTTYLKRKLDFLFALLAFLWMAMMPTGAYAQDPYPNLVVKKISFVDVNGNRLTSIGVNDDVVFKALVANIGDLDIPAGKKIGIQFRVDGKTWSNGYIYWNGDYTKGLSKKGEVWITATGGGGANNATSPGSNAYSWKGTAQGTHTVTAEVNDDHGSNANAVQNESHYEDNTLTETFYVGYPDLIVTDINWTNEDGDAKDNDSIHLGNTAKDFKATLKNNSKVDIPANTTVSVKLSIGDILNYNPADYKPNFSTQTTDQTISYTFTNGLKAGESAVVSFDGFTRKAEATDYIASVSVSGLSGEAETDNNSTSRQFLKVPGWESPYLGKAAGSDIDVIITRVSWMKKTADGKLEPATELYEGDEICFVAYLKNIGTEAVPAGDGSSDNYLLRYGKSGLRLNIGAEYNNGRWCDEYYSRMEPGQEVRLVCNGGGIDFSDAQIGRYWTVADGTLVNVIDNDDPNNGIAAEYGSNNNYNFIVRVKSRNIDLVAEGLSWSPAGKTVTVGTQLSKFTATVGNNSIVDLPSTENIALTVTDDQGNTIATGTLSGGLAQGESVTIPLTMSSDYTPAEGARTLTLTVATAQGETNTANNTYTANLQVNKLLPDLIITNAGWKIRKDDGTLEDAPATLENGAHLVFFATVKNIGTATATPKVGSVIGLPFSTTSGSLQWSDDYNKSLAAGQEVTLVANGAPDWNDKTDVQKFWAAVDGTVITAKVDDREQIDELDEDNNTYTFTVVCGALGRYYLVSPELNNNKVDERYRFQPSRNRSNDASIVNAAVSRRLWTLNLKDDFIASKLNGSTTFHYMIWDADNNKAYRPAADNQQLGYLTDASETTVHEESYACKDGNNTSRTEGNKFVSDTGKGVSYTWLFDNINNNNDVDGNVILNTNKQSLDMNEDYSILGNFVYDFTTANQFHSTIDHENFYKMTRMVYIHGQGRGTQMNEKDYPVTTKDGQLYVTIDGQETAVDSVTYRVAVPRPAKGWEKFGMVVTPTEYLGKPWGTINGSHYNDNWDEATLRPQVQRYNDSSTDPGMNSTAKEGGVFHADNNNRVYSTPTTNMDQAFSVLLPTGVNPPTVLFSINATTSTYRLDYSSDDMYIVGSAVDGTNSDVQQSANKINMVKLTYDSNEHCYKHLDANGKETPVTFNNQSDSNHFRFAYNGDYSQQWYGQDADPANVDFDNQYVDYLGLYQSMTNNKPGDASYDEGKDLRFELNQRANADATTVPAYVRLYLFFSDGTPRYFYTIRKSYTFTRCYPKETQNNDLQSITLTENDYFRMFSEKHAVRLPEAITAYVLSKVYVDETDGDLKAAFTELDAKDENNVRYVPAQTPALLIANLSNQSKEQLNIVLHPYASDPHALYDGKMKNLLTAQIDNTTLGNDENGTNYIVTNQSTDGSYLGMALYKGSGTTGPGYAYLPSTNVPEKSKAEKAKAANYMLVLDIDDPDLATGISKLWNVSISDAWYNLQGQRISAPQGHGIFIHNGKKVLK